VARFLHDGRQRPILHALPEVTVVEQLANLVGTDSTNRERSHDMTSPLDVDIRAVLARYLAGEITLHEFEEWFVAHTWNVHQTRNPIAEELTYTIELLLSDYTSGILDENKLREELRPHLTSYESRFTFDDHETDLVNTGTSARISVIEINFSSNESSFTVREVPPLISAGTRSAEGSELLASRPA